MKSIKSCNITYEYGNVYTNGELWGSEEDFFTAVDDGEIEIIETNKFGQELRGEEEYNQYSEGYTPFGDE